VSLLGPSASALGLLFGSKLRLQQQGPGRDEAQRIVRKKQCGDYFAALLVLDRLATAHFCAADAERREA